MFIAYHFISKYSMFQNKMMANLGTKKLDKYDKFYYIISMEDEVSKYSTEELICFLEGSYAETPPEIGRAHV